MKYIVTGVAGFIGFHVANKLLARGDEVAGIDNYSDYYDPGLKEARTKILERYPLFRLYRSDISDCNSTENIFSIVRPTRVIHLAAQAGVRYSIENPQAYIASNITGFLNVLEACRHGKVDHLTYASSSSVYGANTQMPFSIRQNVDHPVSLYAATKKSNELMAHAYSHLFRLPTTGLRFFTVYGPWGRPDMALFLFVDSILKGNPIAVFNSGRMSRDFTYIDDIVDGVIRASAHVAEPTVASDDTDPSRSSAPYRIYNIGNNSPVELNYLIELLEMVLKRRAIRKLMPLQPGDVPATWADISELTHDTGFKPSTPIEEGVARFVEWYLSYYRI